MVQLTILGGKMAGTAHVARRFPFSIGRAAGCDLRLDEPGVWDQHWELALGPNRRFLARRLGAGLLMINGAAVDQEAELRNGDRIEAGSARLRFWLGSAPLRSIRGRELAVWLLLAGLAISQLALMLFLTR